MTEVDAFVTGGTGFIGRWLLPQLTADGKKVAVLLRGDSRRLNELRDWVDTHGGRGDRLTGLAGDLALPRLGLSEVGYSTASSARVVFHLGAAMAFGLASQTALDVNVRGSERIGQLAANSRRLDRLVLVTGFQHKRSGRLTTNNYHDSKLVADRLVRQLASRESIPLTTIHPGPVVGDSRTGETTQFWGWPTLVQSLYRRRLSVLPGGKQHWMPLAAVDYVAQFIARSVYLDDTIGGEYWLLHADTPPLGDLLSAVADDLGVRRPRLRVPVAMAALGLRAGLDRWTGLPAEALAFVSKNQFPVQSACDVASEIGLREPEPVELATTTARYLVAHQFRPPPSYTE